MWTCLDLTEDADFGHGQKLSCPSSLGFRVSPVSCFPRLLFSARENGLFRHYRFFLIAPMFAAILLIALIILITESLAICHCHLVQ